MMRNVEGIHGVAGFPRPEKKGAVKPAESFSDVLKKFVNDVNDLQKKADVSIEKLAAGEVADVHQVMVAVEEANIALELMLEIRNRIVDAYQEIMRMPI